MTSMQKSRAGVNSFSFKKILDDVFFITSSAPTALPNVANSINSAIHFIFEEPVDDKLHFMNIFVFHNGEMSSLSYTI
jgi:hypothetical protein